MPGGKADGGRTERVMEVILPVSGETVRVAGVRTRVLSGRVRTVRVEARTTSGVVVWGVIVKDEGGPA